MPKMIQVRDVPDMVYCTLKARAEREGMSLSAFIKRELERLAGRLTMQEWLVRARNAKPIRSGRTAVQVIREMRGRG